MQLPEVYIPSFYNAMQQGKADRRTAKLNALQDEFMVNAKKRADQEGEMANEQKKAQYAYNLITQLEKQVAESDRGDAYNSFLLPELQKLYPETQLPQTYSPTALGGLKVKVKSLLPRSVEKVGDQLVVVQGDEAFPIAGTPKSEFSTVTQRFYDPNTGATYEKDVPKQTDIFGNIHTGGMVAVRGYEEPVSLKDYEAYLQANMSPDKFQEYKSTRVTIPVSQSAQSGDQRVPRFTPQSVPQQPVPSPQNTAGRTNQGFAISEDALPQPSAPKQLKYEDLIDDKGRVIFQPKSAPTIDYGDEPPPVAMQNPDMPEMGVNALMGDSMMPEGVNRFAMLKPFGSEPNRFGSAGVEGMEQAYVGNARQVGRAPQPNQPNKLTKEDLMIRASQGDPQALAQIKRMNEIEQSIKGQKVPDRVFKEFQQVKTDMQGVRDTLITMRQSRSDLASGRINLSALSRGSNVPLSILGLQSDTQDRTDTFISNMQAQANALLIENKGVQTDGDAKRAMSQIAQPLAYVNNKKMINALDNGIITLDRLYKKQMSKFADYNKQYPAIGGQ
jgi:hypothetical protein